GRTFVGRMQRCAGPAAWPILNSISTMVKLRARNWGAVRPTPGQTSNSHAFWLAVDGAWQRRSAAVAGRREEVARLIGTHRLAEIPALTDRAAQGHDGMISTLVLNTFDAHRDRQCPCQHRHRAD